MLELNQKNDVNVGTKKTKIVKKIITEISIHSLIEKMLRFKSRKIENVCS